LVVTNNWNEDTIAMAFRLPRCMRSYTADLPLTRVQETQMTRNQLGASMNSKKVWTTPAVTVIELNSARNAGPNPGDAGGAQKS